MLLLQRVRLAKLPRGYFKALRFVSYESSKRPNCLRPALKNCRFNSPLPYSPKKPVFPAQLLIYHAGMGMNVYIGALKLTTGFVFLFFAFIAWPYCFGADQNLTMAALLFAGGMVPGAYVYYTTRPFVSYVHFRLPINARQSRQTLVQYARNLPPNSVVDITTLNFFGLPKVNIVKVSELLPVKQYYGIANFGRDATALNAKRPWWAGKAVDRFGIHNGKGKVREAGVWKIIEQNISSRPLLVKRC